MSRRHPTPPPVLPAEVNDQSLAMLVNEHSASAAEMVAAFASEYQL